MSKESREIEKLNPDEEVGKKRKIVFWSMIANGIGVIVVIALLLIFLLPKDDKFEIDLGSNVSVEDGTLTGEGSYKKGDSVTIVAEDIDGYRFTGWSYGGSIISTDKEYTFQINEENEGEYTANYAKIYTVSTFDNDNYGSFTVAPTEAIAGETVTVRYEVNSENQDKYQLKRLYYVIAGESDQVTIENNAFTMPEGNVTIYAEFNNLYNINLTTNIDEEVNLTGEGTYIENETVTISAPNIAGYRFRNWTYNGQVVTTQQEYTITNIDSTTSGTYIANYDRLYSITVNSSHGTVAIVDNKTNAIENENIEFTVEPNSDYRLIEVRVNNETLTEQDGKYTFAMPAENVSIEVTYSQLFDISVTSEHGTVTITDNKTEAIANENVSFTVQAESGYRIENISINNGDVEYTQDENTYSFTMPAGDVEIMVVYEEEYVITIDPSAREIVTAVSKDNAMSGDQIIVTVNAKDIVTDDQVTLFSGLYYIENGSEDKVTINLTDEQYSFIMPSADITIYAEYEDRDRYQNFFFSENIVYYSGNDSTVVIPSSYSMIQLDRDNILNFENKEELDKIMQSQIASMQINTGYFQVKTNTDEDYSTELITDVQTWYQGLIEEQFPLSIKLPTNLSKAQNGNGVEDVVDGLGAQLQIGRVKSFDIKVDDDPVVTVDSAQDYYSYLNSKPAYVENLEITNVIYCEKIYYVGSDIPISNIGAISGNVTEVTIPSIITDIERNGFTGCSNLNIRYQGTIDQWASINFKGAWSYVNNVDLYVNGELIKEITLNYNINDYSFYGIGSIVKVTINEKVKSIGYEAFRFCSNLNEIVIESKDIYQAATGQSQAGYLLQKATTVKVLKTIDDGSNTFLSTTGGYTLDDSSDPKYNIYTK